MPLYCEYRIIGEVVSILKLDLGDFGRKYYVRIDCGFLVDYPLSESELIKFKTGEYKIGDYVMVKVTRFDVELPNASDYKIATL